MSLSRGDAEGFGLAFSVEGEARPEAPDQDIWEADLTIDGHTERFAGKSEQDVLDQAERVLLSRGRLKKDEGEPSSGEPGLGQKTDNQDLAAFRGQRDETLEEVEKQDDQDEPLTPA